MIHFNLHFGKIRRYHITQISIQNRNDTVIWNLVLPFFSFPSFIHLFLTKSAWMFDPQWTCQNVFLNGYSTSKAVGWTFLLLDGYVQTIQVEEMRLLVIWPLKEGVCGLLCRQLIAWPWVSAWLSLHLSSSFELRHISLTCCCCRIWIIFSTSAF